VLEGDKVVRGREKTAEDCESCLGQLEQHLLRGNQSLLSRELAPIAIAYQQILIN
jgi:hypothetical protein